MPVNSIRGEIINSEPMKKHTSLRVGGAAQYFYKPSDVTDLVHFLSLLDNDISIFWLGRGSNILVRDEGLSGVVISSSKILREITKINDLTNLRSPIWWQFRDLPLVRGDTFSGTGTSGLRGGCVFNGQLFHQRHFLVDQDFHGV